MSGTRQRLMIFCSMCLSLLYWISLFRVGFISGLLRDIWGDYLENGEGFGWIIEVQKVFKGLM